MKGVYVYIKLFKSKFKFLLLIFLVRFLNLFCNLEIKRRLNVYLKIKSICKKKKNFKLILK